MRTSRYVLLSLFMLCLFLLPADAGQTAMVAMEDGTRLATDIHLPKGQGKWPTVLIRTPYGRKMDIEKDFLGRRYALVIQDIRGSGDSEGEKNIFYADGWREGLSDGATMVRWMLAQPWCNGKIGTYGGSAVGVTQMLLAPTTKNIHAQYIHAAPGSLYPYCVYNGGVFRKNMMEGWLNAIEQPHLIPVYKAHPYKDAFWSFYDAQARVSDITAPALFVNGWYDIFQQGTIDAFQAREKKGGPGAKGKNYLVMTWAGHGQDTTTEYKLDANRLSLKVYEILNAFYDANLKGRTSKLDDVSKVHYYVMGDDKDPDAPGNEWRTADQWPPEPTTATPLYLTKKGLSRGAGATGSKSFTYDPANPYPTCGGANLLMPSGPYDQRKHSQNRKDLLKFATLVLEKPVEVIGEIKISLTISTDVPDTDFTAMLVDIFPEGDEREINVVSNIQRVKMRNSLSKPEPLLTGPDEQVTLEFTLGSAAWAFNTGHRIGLHISSSDYPRYEVNPNTGADFPVEGKKMRVAINTVHIGGLEGSRLILPVVE